MQSNTQSNTQNVQSYLVQSIKELAALLDAQALDTKTVQDIINTAQDLLHVQAATNELVQAQQAYTEYTAQPVPEVINDGVVAAYKAQRQNLRTKLTRAYAVYSNLNIPRTMQDARVWSHDELAMRTR